MFRTKEQLLFRYLKQNNLFTNVKLINKIKLNKTNINFINFFDLSLHWKNTNEGFDFWSDINIKWRDILRNKLGHNTMALYNLNGNDII
jgi:hypothetical protein